MKKILSALFLVAVTFALAACTTNGLPKPKVGAFDQMSGQGAAATVVRTTAIEQPYTSGDTIEYLKVVELDPATGKVVNTATYVVQGKTPGRAIADDVLGAGVIAAGGITAVKLAKGTSLVNQAYSASGASASATAGASVTTP